MQNATATATIPTPPQDVYVDSFTLDTSHAYRAQLIAEMVRDLQHAPLPTTLEDALEQVDELRSSLIEYMLEKWAMHDFIARQQREPRQDDDILLKGFTA